MITTPPRLSTSLLQSKPRFLAVKFPPTKSVRSLEQPNTEHPEGDSKYQNIFSLTKFINEEYEINNRGPKLTEKGAVVPYTILGKPEWFKNMQNSKESLPINVKESENRAQNSTFSELQENPRLTRPMTSYVGSQNRSAGSAQIPIRPFSTREKRGEDSQKNLEKFGVVMKKEEVLEEVNKITNRVYRDKALLKKRKVPLSAKFFQNKEANCLRHFDEQEKHWEVQAKLYSKKLARNINDKPLYDKGDCFRQKLELAQVVDNLKTDHEKFGDRYWELTLRKYEESNPETPNKPGNRTMSDWKKEFLLKNTKNQQIKLRPTSATIETIRNPKREYKEMPFSSFKSDGYLKGKLMRFEEKVREMHPILKPQEVGSLHVLGEDKCKKEIECVLEKLRTEDSQKANFIKYKGLEGVPEIAMEETIKSAFSLKNMISKTGFYKNPFKIK